MNTSTRYFGSSGAFGSVSALPAASWPEFVAQRLEAPARLTITRASFRALSEAERKAAKRAPYFTPAVFRTSPSNRRLEEAVSIALVCLDVDDSSHARPLLSRLTTSAPLLPYAHAVYHTASSTPEAPRLRVVVPCEPLAVPAYPRAVAHLAHLLELPHVTPESTVAVQPMFVPTLFLGDDLLGFEPLVARSLEAPLLRFSDLPTSDSPHAPTTSRKPAQQAGIGPLDDATALAYLTAPLEGFPVESAEKVLAHVDPDLPRDQWIKVLCAIQHQFGRTPEALDLFDAWSAKGAKYPGREDLEKEWNSRTPHALGRQSFTFRSVIHMAKQAGFDLGAAESIKALNAVLEWIRSPSRTSEELWFQALPKIAALPKRGPSEDEAVLQTLSSALRKRGYAATKVALRKSLAQLTRSEANLFRDPKATPESQLPTWARGLCFVGGADQFFDRRTRQARKAHTLDRELSRYFTADGASHPEEIPSDYLLNKVKIPVVADYLYLPTSTDPYPEHPHRPGPRYVNTYIPDFPEGDPTRAAEAGRIIRAHLEHLIEEADYRDTLLAWMAYHVQHPGEKIRWAVLLQGAQGCGKTALGAIMSAALGASNVKHVSGSLVVASAFNEWMEGAQCIVLEEIRVAGHNRTDVMNSLKPAITNDTLSINQKRRDAREVLNVANYLLLTNHHDALAVSDSDRRYFVLESRLQTREQVLALPEGYFAELFGCIQGNAPGIRAFLETWPIPESFNPQGPAPMTKYLGRLQQVAGSPVHLAISEALEDSGDPLVSPTHVSIKALRDVLERDGGLGRDMEDRRLTLALAELGFHRHGRAMHLGVRHSLWTRGEEHREPTTLLAELMAQREILGLGVFSSEI